MKLPNLELNDIDDLHNDLVYLLIVNKEGYRVYYAKVSASQIALLDYKVGDEVLFTTVGQPGIQRYHIHEIRRMLVRRGRKHEIHLHVEVSAFPPDSSTSPK